jgi:ribosomal protein S18 acetylase RimI-like enzyme
LFSLLSVLDGKYPGGLGWLDRRLDDVESGRAFAHLVSGGDFVAAAAVVTPKGARHMKLSTLFVHPRYRRLGLASRLTDRLLLSWPRAGVEQVVVTVDGEDLATAAFFEKRGFENLADQRVPYGEVRWDRVMRWTPHAPGASSFAEV